MLTCQKLFNKPNKLMRFTGLTQEQYHVLVTKLQPLWERSEFKRLWHIKRKRDLGAGRHYRLIPLEDKLLVILLWYRTYTVLELLGWIFHLDATNIGRLIQKLTPLVEETADPELLTYLKKRTKETKKDSYLG